ncbi:MAG: site-specific integrase [Chloroflexota bacterium]
MAGLVELPAPPHRARPILTVEQARALIAGVEGAALGGLHVLALTTGLREGQLFGLAWEDVDWQAGVVLLRHNLTWLRGRGPALKVPKSGRGRAVVLTPQGLAALRRRQVAQAAERLAGGRAWSNPWHLIFTNRLGLPLDASNVLRLTHYPALRALGLPKVRFHDLRHTAASLLIFLGVPLTVVRDILGHSQITITAETYAHLLPGMQAGAMAKLGALLTG